MRYRLAVTPIRLNPGICWKTVATVLRVGQLIALAWLAVIVAELVASAFIATAHSCLALVS